MERARTPEFVAQVGDFPGQFRCHGLVGLDRAARQPVGVGEAPIEIPRAGRRREALQLLHCGAGALLVAPEAWLGLEQLER
jgi:hypothetical protein